jgi:hypothetical protein
MRAHHLGRVLNVSLRTATSMMRRLESAAAKMNKMDSADARGPLAAHSLLHAVYASGPTLPL